MFTASCEQLLTLRDQHYRCTDVRTYTDSMVTNLGSQDGNKFLVIALDLYRPILIYRCKRAIALTDLLGISEAMV